MDERPFALFYVNNRILSKDGPRKTEFTNILVWSHYPTTPQPKPTLTKINSIFDFFFSFHVENRDALSKKKKKKVGREELRKKMSALVEICISF